MSKKKPEIRMVSFGRYTPFDRRSKELPKVMEFTTQIPAELGVEFGYILQIRKARGARLTIRIDHPPFPDESGQVSPPFTGQQYVRTSDYEFFLGDTVWAPVEDKVGDWTLTTWLEEEQIATKTFQLYLPEKNSTGDRAST
jgi:hypothetical protein